MRGDGALPSCSGGQRTAGDARRPRAVRAHRRLALGQTAEHPWPLDRPVIDSDGFQAGCTSTVARDSTVASHEMNGSVIWTSAPASGLRRGVVVYLNGLFVVGAANWSPGAIGGSEGTMLASLVADQWVVINVPGYAGVMTLLPGPGSPRGGGVQRHQQRRWVRSALPGLDRTLVGSRRPVHPHHLRQLAHRPLRILLGSDESSADTRASNPSINPYGSWQAHRVLTILSNIPSIWTPPANFGATTTTGINVTATRPDNAVTIPVRRRVWHRG